ncbi:integrator complex subunit 7-like [Physella acuta]|uniref:integrator complex subunit 7-like n=1 Tax=Physella acuta TaxID=109671 RepID=UPI0027DE20F7|nr:integrator complex subunit 7-like [Physella acuta]
MAASIQSKQLSNVSFEQEQDANSALTELDKALRSGQIGIQCEAVVKFPRLFEKYPFPILINSAMLKIADVFRVGNNFIRLCILRVTQQSEKHLDKIFSVDEFTRRIFGVIHSNDPVARAITLRTLGSVASIISEKKNVHHSIILCLDSHNAVEVEAAIFAAEKFSEKSKMFAASVCSKIGAMIAGLSTPTEMKLRLIPILQHMHHDTETATKAIDLCQSVLTSYPARKFVVLTLQTLTQLTIKTLLNLQDQVLRLLSYLTSDPRNVIKAVCLDNLKLLAVRAAYLWTAPNLEEVAKFALQTTSSHLKVKAVRVLNAVFGNVAVTLVTLPSDTAVLDVCREFCYHSSTDLATQAIQLLTYLAKFKCIPGDLTAEAVGAIQTLIILLASDLERKNLVYLKIVLKCAVDVCHSYPDVSDKIVQTLTSLLGTSEETSQLHLCECLAAIGSECPAALDFVSPQILASLTTTISHGTREVSHVQVHMCTLLFQAGCQKPMSAPIFGQVMACINQANPWIAYKVARQAMRYCQYQVAYAILKSLNLKVVTENAHYWLLGLQHSCAAENHIKQAKSDNSDLSACITDALQMYVKSHVTLKAASTPTYPLEFASDYVNLRMQVLQAHHLLLLSRSSFSAKPAPAISTALAATNGQEGTRWAQVVIQLQKCLNEYKEASTLASNLYRSAFDADPASLLNINVIQQCCNCMKSVITTIISTIQTGQCNFGDRQFLTPSKKNEAGVQTSGVSATLNIMRDISSAMDRLLPENNLPAVISYKLMDILSTSVEGFVRASPSFPRFFFQTMQNTVVKLAVSPQQSPNQEPITLRADTHLSLKVEGVVQRGERPALFRQVTSVTISVSTNLTSRSSVVNTNAKANETTSVHLSQTVNPHNDYFSTSFVLPFPVLGIHVAKVEASVVDENGVTWNTGPRTSLTVKSYDDSLQRQQQQQQMRARTQQQPSTSLGQQNHFAPPTHT